MGYRQPKGRNVFLIEMPTGYKKKGSGNTSTVHHAGAWMGSPTMLKKLGFLLRRGVWEKSGWRS